MHRHFLGVIFIVLVACGKPSTPVLSSKDPEIAKLSVLASELRALPFLRSVANGKKSKDEIQQYVETRIREDYAPGEIDLESRTLVLLGLLPPTFAYEKFLLAMYRQEIAGYYDPRAKALYLADWIPAKSAEPIIIHELVHSLQDQHYSLVELIKRPKGNDDRIMAINALIEGDAFGVMLDLGLREQKDTIADLPDMTAVYRQQLLAEKNTNPLFKDTPKFLMEGLLFPYVEGCRFIRHVRRKGGWSLVAKMFKDPPISTEQILHPEKFVDKKDAPIEIPTSHFSVNKKALWTNVFGEFGWRMILDSFLSEKDAAHAAQGWGGDRFWLTSFHQEDALIAAVVWDDLDEAKEFEEALRKSKRKSFVIVRNGKRTVVGLGKEMTENDAREFLGGFITSP